MMGSYSTLKITRSKAREELIKKFFNISDIELEYFMDEILEPRLYNCRIVDDDEDNDDELV